MKKKPVTTRIILVRHGLTVMNIQGRINGHLHDRLAPKGRIQAEKVGKRLCKENIDKIYVSDLKRALETAKEISKHHKKISIIKDKRLRERAFGMYDGELRSKFIDKLKSVNKKYLDFKPKGGESIIELKKRAQIIIDEIIRSNSGKTILIITHGTFIVSTLLNLTKDANKNYLRYVHHNTGVSIVDITGKKVKLHTLNCTKHLNDELLS